MKNKKIILSGIQATGRLTLGNYLGAIKNWTKLQKEYDCYYMIADLHSLTVKNDPEALRKNTLNIIALYVACGLDPEKNNIFIQSNVSAHAELAWILNCYTYVGELSRMTQYKDKSAKNADNVNSGLFTYPVLMAADILLYQTNVVPVGEDQKQHLEITRDIAMRFNKLYGKTFTVPEPYIAKAGARIMGLQNPTAKMSKSSKDLNDVIFLDDSPNEIINKIKKSKTDSENIVRYDIKEKPGISNLITIYSVLTERSTTEIEEEFKDKGYGYFKDKVAETIIDKVSDIQKRHKAIIENEVYLEEIYENGARKAKRLANRTLRDVKKKIGLIV